MSDKAHILFVEETNDDAEIVIQRYDDHSVVINGETYTNSIIVTPQSVTSWPINHTHQINEQVLATLATEHPEVLLIGTGTQSQLLAPKLTAPLMTAGIGIEVMNNGAAIRTFVALAAEGRNVLLALIQRRLLHHFNGEGSSRQDLAKHRSLHGVNEDVETNVNNEIPR